MKFLITGLGNIGPEYAGTRHNIGFRIVDHIAEAEKLSFSVERYGSVAEWKYKGKTLIMLKPSTFMNLSGQAVRYWLQHEKLGIEQLLVLVDDLALPFGTIRLKPKGSDGGHNGLRSINELLETQAYARLRFGIGSDFQTGRQIDYVLGPWTAAESEDLPERLAIAADAVKSFVTIGTERTMNLFNNK